MGSTYLLPGTISLIGMPGAGKSTVIKAAAGLMRPDAGHLDIAGETLMDTAAGIFVMAHAQGAAGIKNAIRAGIRSIEHGIFLDDEAIELMLQAELD